MLLERLHEGWCGSNLLTNINSLTCILSLIPHAHSFRHVWFHLQIASVISIQTMYGHSAYNLDSVVGSAKKDRYCNSIVLFPLSAVTWRSFDANSFLGTAKKSAVCKNIGINGGLNSNHSEVLHLVTIGMSHILQSPHLLVHVCKHCSNTDLMFFFNEECRRVHPSNRIHCGIQFDLRDKDLGRLTTSSGSFDFT